MCTVEELVLLHLCQPTALGSDESRGAGKTTPKQVSKLSLSLFHSLFLSFSRVGRGWRFLNLPKVIQKKKKKQQQFFWFSTVAIVAAWRCNIASYNASIAAAQRRNVASASITTALAQTCTCALLLLALQWLQECHMCSWWLLLYPPVSKFLHLWHMWVFSIWSLVSLFLYRCSFLSLWVGNLAGHLNWR